MNSPGLVSSDKSLSIPRSLDTNNTDHHHYYLEDRHELMDIPSTDVAVGRVPLPPEGYEIDRVDVVVRLRRKREKSSSKSSEREMRV